MYTTLITATVLAQNITAPDWVVIDCRHDLANPEAGRVAYAAGHIPQAQFAHLDLDLSGPKIDADGRFGGRHPLPERDKFIEMLRSWGISNDTQVVAYDAHGGMFAARLWWLLRWVGHPAVAVLDGGLGAWQLQALDISTEPVTKTPGRIGAKNSLVNTVSADDVLDSLADRTLTLIDARSADRYRGENETLDPVGGHIPGAKNRFFKDNLRADGCFKSPDELRADFSALIASPVDAVMQCGSGVTACHNLLALEVAGLSGAALYPGSWSEWCSDATRPIATGT